MRCDTARELFSDYLEGKAERPLALTFEQHLAECAECASDYKEFSNVWNSLDNLPEVEPPLSFRAQVMTRVQQQCASRRRERKWSINWGGILSTRIPARAFAAAFVLLLFAGLALQMGSPPNVIRSGGAVEFETSWPTTSNDINRGNTGLQFTIAPVTTDGQAAYRMRIEIKDSDVAALKLYLLPSAQTNFMPSALEGAPSILVPGVKGSVWTDILGPGTAYLQWYFRGERFSEVIFLPTQLAPSKPEAATFESPGLSLYAALAAASEVYGIVIVSDADLGAPIISAEPSFLTSAEALAKIAANVDGSSVRWKKMQTTVYAITRG